jgi:hypothetical protein
MSTSNLPHRLCICDDKLTAAEAELRSKARRYPECAIGYQAAANEIVRVRSIHFAECQTCQSAELAQIATAGKDAGAAHAS